MTVKRCTVPGCAHTRHPEAAPITVTLTEDDQFFYDNASWSYASEQGETSEHGHALCAMMLADAERKAKRLGWYVTWTLDSEPHYGDRDTGPGFIATLRDSEGEVITSMGGNATGDTTGNRARVIFAELAMSVPS